MRWVQDVQMVGCCADFGNSGWGFGETLRLIFFFIHYSLFSFLGLIIFSFIIFTTIFLHVKLVEWEIL